MSSRLMSIKIKTDGYIYENKPISVDEAYSYARELEQLRHQCSGERHLQVIQSDSLAKPTFSSNNSNSITGFQVIEKLTSYMKFIIGDNSPKDVTESNKALINKLNNKHVHFQDAVVNSNIDFEMERSISNLSIIELKDSLDPLKTNNSAFKKTAQIENSTSTVDYGNGNAINNPTVENTELDIVQNKHLSQKQIETADNENTQSQNLRSNFEYKNHSTLNTLRNYRKTKIEQTDQSIEYLNRSTITKNCSMYSSNTSCNLKRKDQDNTTKDVDQDDTDSTQSMVIDFENGNFTHLGSSNNNKNPKHVKPNNITEYRNNKEYVMKRKNYNKKLVVSGTNTKQSIQIEQSHNGTEYSQNLLRNINYRDTTEIIVTQNNTYSKFAQPLNVVNKSTNKDSKNNVNNYNDNIKENYNTGIEISNRNTTTQRNIDQNINKLLQTLPSGFKHVNYVSQNNSTNPTYTQSYATIPKSNKIKKKIETSPNFNKVTSDEHNKNQARGIDKVKKQRKTVKKDATKMSQTGKNNQKRVNVTAQSKINNDKDSTNLKNPEKNKRTYVKKKKDNIDLSWVENMKFSRVIETEEYATIDNLQEVFCSDSTLPSNVNLTDFAYDDINIWRI